MTIMILGNICNAQLRLLRGADRPSHWSSTMMNWRRVAEAIRLMGLQARGHHLRSRATS